MSICNGNDIKMQRFPLENFGSSDKKHTFASAFEKQRYLKQNEIEKYSGKR